MKANCLDIGIVQAFLDGELSHVETTRVSDHIALCKMCAAMLAEADEQSAVVFSALEREFDTLVPTQRLWNRINDSLQTERENRSLWQKVCAFAAMAFANPSIAAAASLLIVVGIFAAVWMNQAPASVNIAINEPKQSLPVVSPVAPEPTQPVPTDRVIDSRSSASYTVERASYRPETRRVSAPRAITAAYLPGEESYVRTISSLAKTVDEQKDGGVMSPSERVAYERDMAVVNDAIASMKKEVRRNPRSELARQVLYSSYQNKIDLLNSVSQKEELLVSIR